MKKLSLLISLLFLITSPAMVYGMEKVDFKENNPKVSIYAPGTIDEINFVIEYGNTENSKEFVENNKEINLLLINGTFVPNAEIIVNDNITLVPLRLVIECLGGDVFWDNRTEKILVNIDGITVIMHIGESVIEFNGQERKLNAPVKIINNRTYIPISFISEYLLAYVDSTINFEVNTGHNSTQDNININQIIIEKPEKTEKVFEIQDGLDEARRLSLEAYDQTVDYTVEVHHYDFKNSKDNYDSQKIKYIGDMGRYYIYELYGYEDYKIFYNRYTGELFSQKAGLPIVNIDKGFINISWMFN